MSGDPKECREHAQDCLRLAADARTPASKETFQKLAQRWLVLAAELEAARSLLETWGDPVESRSKSIQKVSEGDGPTP